MDKDAAGRAFWSAMGVIYIGGAILYFAGAKPRSPLSQEVIPVDEPTVLDWVQIGGILYFT